MTPSAISPARRVLSGPSAASRIGSRSCTGAIVSRSALPGPSGQRQRERLAGERDALARERHAARPRRTRACAGAGARSAGRASPRRPAGPTIRGPAASARPRDGRSSPPSSPSSRRCAPASGRRPRRAGCGSCGRRATPARSRRRCRRPPTPRRRRIPGARPPARARAARAASTPNPQWPMSTPSFTGSRNLRRRDAARRRPAARVLCPRARAGSSVG